MNDSAQAIMSLGFFGAIAVTIRSVAQVWVKRLDVKQHAADSFDRDRPVASTAMEQRLARIETAVDAISLEVERISEAQRFAARLPAERDQRAIASLSQNAAAGRTITPH
jgi:hypothetical protein